MNPSVIIINDTIINNSEAKTEYDKYFDDIYEVSSISELPELFNAIDSEYVVVVTANEFYAEDSYMLYRYLKHHDLDYIVGNRVYTHQYLSLDSLYKICNKKSSNRLSKLTGCYIPDLFSTSYVLTKSFYKSLLINNNFQLDCIRHSHKFAYIDIRCKVRKYSKSYSIKKYISARLYRKDIK